MADSIYTTFLKDPDQVSRRAELATFFGPNPDKFLRVYDSQVALVQRVPGQSSFSFGSFGRTFLWPAFFLGAIWLFYRKMWAYGIGLTVLILILGLLPITNRLGLPLGIALAGFGGLAYVSHAVNQIEKLRRQNPTQPLDPQQPALIGGVSRPAGIIGGIVYVLIIALAIFGIVALGHATR